jgi:hypothetical protein
MSRAAISMLSFGIYLFGLGVVLLVAPNALLSLFGLPPTEEVWLRVVGMLVFLLGAYYSLASRHELRPFFRWTVVARSSVILFFAAFVLLGYVKPVLIVFGVIDLLGAGWTALALHSDGRDARPAAGAVSR